MIYLDEMVIGPKTLINTWLTNTIPNFLSKQQTNMISMLSNWIIEPCLDFVTEKCEQFLVCSKMHLTISFLKLFECMLDDIRLIFYVC
jgi:hypothetical protein